MASRPSPSGSPRSMMMRSCCAQAMLETAPSRSRQHRDHSPPPSGDEPKGHASVHCLQPAIGASSSHFSSSLRGKRFWLNRRVRATKGPGWAHATRGRTSGSREPSTRSLWDTRSPPSPQLIWTGTPAKRLWPVLLNSKPQKMGVATDRAAATSPPLARRETSTHTICWALACNGSPICLRLGVLSPGARQACWRRRIAAGNDIAPAPKACCL